MNTDGLIKSIDALLSLDARGALVPHGIGDLARELLEKCAEALTQPAPQPHPEPIAWMVGTAIWWTKEEAERDAVAMGLPIVGMGPMSAIAPAGQHRGEPAAWRGLNELGEVVTEWIEGAPPSSMVNLCGNPASFASIEQAYTHTDPGEAEDLLALTSLEFGERLDAVEKERDTLRALLDEIAKWHWSGVDFDLPADLVTRIKAISASAEPSAPAPMPAYMEAACDKFDWTPEEALRFYAEGKHFDIDRGRTRILCTGAIASHALKGMGGEYADMKGVEPSAPVERDERAAFESWAKSEGHFNIRRNPYGYYRFTSAAMAWKGWQARAALERKSQVQS